MLEGSSGRVAALVALDAADQFVRASSRFRELLRLALETAIVEVRAEGGEAVRELLEGRREGRTLGERLAAAGHAGGPPPLVRAVARIETESGAVGAYVHHDGKSGALVALAAEAPFEVLRAAAHELAMHAVARASRGESRGVALDVPWFRDESVSGSDALTALLGGAPRIEAAFVVRT